MPCDHSLSKHLKSWRLKVPGDTCFRAGVWQRIERFKAEASWSGYARGHAGALALAMALTVGASGVAGYGIAQLRHEKENRLLAAQYVVSLDNQFHAALKEELR